MSSMKNKGEKHESGKFRCFDHVTYWVGNAKQAASHYCARFGFEPVAYKGLETGSRAVAAHVIRQNKCTLVFQNPIEPREPKEMYDFLSVHGDAVKDIAFEVEDLDALYQTALARGGKVVKEPWTESDESGSVRFAKIKTFGDITHTLVERKDFEGTFLPGYGPPTIREPLNSILPEVGLVRIDHVVGNQPESDMMDVVKWYESTLLFHRFFTVDDDICHTNYSGLKAIVVANFEETIKMPIIEPAPSQRAKSQIQEFLDYNGGPGVQHVCFGTGDLLTAVKNLRARGIDFLEAPDSYYVELKKRLDASNVKLREDFEQLRKAKILIDFDDKGYLLQIFCQNMQDRPTFFLELMQRFRTNSYGANNFKALFEAIEREQAKRGNLHTQKIKEENESQSDSGSDVETSKEASSKLMSKLMVPVLRRKVSFERREALCLPPSNYFSSNSRRNRDPFSLNICGFRMNLIHAF